MASKIFLPLVAVAGIASAGQAQSCPADIPLSCQNTTAVQDTCCFMPSGQLLLTQFWDTEPVTGPSDSWTIHGLWPDNCDGSYPKNCAPERQHSNIRSILSSGGGNSSVLATMGKYWKDYKGDDESFWSHEWNKHGTCVSTLEPNCYFSYTENEEVVDYFERTVALFEELPTYKWLQEAGITPSDSETYAYADIKDALEEKHGREVTVKCKGKVLNEVWYHFNVKGSLQEGQFVAAEPDGVKGGCPAQVQYKVKN